MEARKKFKEFWSHFEKVHEYEISYREGLDVPIDFIRHSTLDNKTISFNPLQEERFPDPEKTFFFVTPSIGKFWDFTTDLLYLADAVKYPGGKILVWGPIGSGKSFAGAIDALHRRMSSDFYVVLISNPDIIVADPGRVLHELIYAFADDDLSEDVSSESFKNHPMHLIKNAYEEISKKHFRGCIDDIRALTKQLSLECDKRGREFVLYLDQVNTMWTPGEARPGALFLRSEFVNMFDYVIAISSATNDLLSRDKTSGYNIRSITPEFDQVLMTFFVKSYLNLSNVDEEQISAISGFVGNSLLDLVGLLRCSPGSLDDKIHNYGEYHNRQIRYIYKLHSKWLRTYMREHDASARPYIALTAFADTGIPIEDPRQNPALPLELSDPRRRLSERIISEIDNRFFSFNDETMTLSTISPAARIAVNLVISVLRTSYPIQVSQFLTLDQISNGQIRGQILERLLHSIFVNRLADVRDPESWPLPLPEEVIVVSNYIKFACLKDFDSALTTLPHSDVYHPIITIGNFPVTDAMLVNYQRKKMIFFQATTHPAGHKKSASVLFNSKHRGKLTSNFVLLISFLHILEQTFSSSMEIFVPRFECERCRETVGNINTDILHCCIR